MRQFVKDIGKYSFPHRTVEKWNALNNEVVIAHNAWKCMLKAIKGGYTSSWSVCFLVAPLVVTRTPLHCSGSTDASSKMVRKVKVSLEKADFMQRRDRLNFPSSMMVKTWATCNA
ncbi:hypothetical protein E2C01_034752 [Portunus trituberculatus]|uniref:Uncharacterized protein n=1 Tax=Portunus trituberculatus TaxID=210409 RepID=A0A5B7F6I5_PORTR|nr:hypothetical protein [Portunus trituberculatus]